MGHCDALPDEDVGIEKNVHRLAVSKGGHEIVRHLIKIIMDTRILVIHLPLGSFTSKVKIRT